MMSNPKNVRTVQLDSTATIKAGERIRWMPRPSVYRPEPKRFVYTQAGLVEALCDEGHEATVTVSVSRNALVHAIGTCSCGHERPIYMTSGGKLGGGAVASWRAHMENLAAPHVVWRAESSRLNHECVIVTPKMLTGIVPEGEVKAHLSREKNWDLRYCTVLFRRVKKTGADSSPPKVINSHRSLAEAVQYARGLGVRKDGSGTYIFTWVDDPPVKKATGEAAALLAALDRAATPTEILNAMKLADSYLDYADVIRAKKAEVMKRMDDLF